MIPCIGAEIGGVMYYPLFNNNAMFRLQEEPFPDDVMEKLNENTKAGFKLAFDVFRVLCEEGNAIRARYGYEKGPLPDWEAFQQEFVPADLVKMKNALFAAISMGYTREIPSLEDVDLTLLEIPKKTE
ncbi:MAG: hypothetical protein LUC89_05815 [Oscillospiraceae bacterium]|nr:hypothetical protein [Oscillospiraceae bacterium]